jgi:hypothetical protein
MEDKEVRRSTTLRSVGSAAKAASVLDHHPVLGEGAVTMQLRQLAAELLVIRHHVEHTGTHRHAC